MVWTIASSLHHCDGMMSGVLNNRIPGQGLAHDLPIYLRPIPNLNVLEQLAVTYGDRSHTTGTEGTP